MSDAPPRPESVSDSARWDPQDDDPGFEWVEGEVDEKGERHGDYRFWTKEGVLHGACTYVHGKIEGINENYHPDGSIASKGEWKGGVIFSATHFRAKGDSPEPWPGDVGEKVMSVRYVSEDGKSNLTIKYFDADGNPIGMDGEALPPLPEGVPETARWFPSRDEWVDGAIMRGTNAQIGLWRWWNEKGVLKRREERDETGEVSLILAYDGGKLDKKEVYEGGVRVLYEGYRDDGETLFVRRKKNADGKEILKEYYWQDGSLNERVITEWDGERIVARTEIDEGQKVFEAKLAGGRLHCVLFQNEGKDKSAEGHLDEDGETIVGEWIFYDGEGEEELRLDLTGKGLQSSPTHERLPWRLNAGVFTALEKDIPEVPQLAASKAMDWASVESCYGNTEDFHRYLRALVSPNARCRSYGSGQIYGECLHQGTVYETTARVMPFLIALLEHPDADIPTLLEMIHDFASAAAPWVGEAKEAREERDEEPESEGEDWTFAVLGTVEEVGKGWNELWALMDSKDESIRRTVLSLASLPPPSDEIRSALKGFATNADESEAMRAVAVEAYSCIEGMEIDDLLPYLEAESPLVRATIAIEMGMRFGPHNPDKVVDALEAALELREKIAPQYHELPFVHAHLLARISLAVGSIGSQGNEHARRLTLPLVERIEDVSGADAPGFGQGLLALVLGRGERPFGKDFLRVLETLATSRSFNAFNVNAAEVLEMWNLPRYAEPLGEFVEELKKADDPEAALHTHMHDE